MAWPLAQPDLADETIWRTAIRDALPVENELGYTEGRDSTWIRERVGTPEFSILWLLARMVADGELTALPRGNRVYYRKTGVVGTPANGPAIEIGALDASGATHGAILIRGAAEAEWKEPGTAGWYLRSEGPGLDPEWVALPAGVTDHGALTGLADDDHPQYHNDARGDARYEPLGAVATHEGAGDPHPQYAEDADLLGYATISHQHATTDLIGITSDRLLGRDSPGSGPAEEIGVGGGIEFTGAAAIQTAAFTGDVTKAAGGTALTIPNSTVANAKLATMEANTVKANPTASTANPSDLTVGANTVVGRGGGGNIVAAQVATGQIGDDAVTYAKMQNVSATDRVLGRSSAGAGDVQEIVCTAAGRALIDDATALEQRTTLGFVSAVSPGQSSIGTSFTNVTGLGLAVDANTDYDFEFVIYAQTSATTVGIDVACTGPASPTAIFYDQVSWTGTSTVSTVVAFAYDNNTANGTSAGASWRSFRVKGILRNGANAGTLQARIKGESGTGTEVLVGSYGRATKLT